MITVTGLSKTFRAGADTVRAIDDISLAISDNEFFVLLGLSGSGKTSLLRSIAGLERPDTGEIAFGDRIVFSARRGICVPPRDRGIGMVFQSYAVWPHMTVFENVAFPLRHGARRHDASHVRQKVMAALNLVQLQGLEHRPVPFLSGGQQQRVALARALAVEPDLLLMDEPLSNLDARLREDVRNEIKAVATKTGISVMYVTHDQVEAMALADTIAVMDGGKVLQIGRPRDLYDAPVNRRVGEFLGAMNQFEGHAESDGLVATGLASLCCCPTPTNLRARVVVAIRPEDVCLSLMPTGMSNEFAGTISDSFFLGDMTLYHVAVNGTTVDVKLTASDARLQRGRSVYVRLPTEKLKIFPLEQS